VPIRCAANSNTKTTTVIGMTSDSSSGSTTRKPSTADSTEIAGVIMLSATNSDAPKIPSTVNTSTVRARNTRAGAGGRPLRSSLDAASTRRPRHVHDGAAPDEPSG
jgi:hypothetical protein